MGLLKGIERESSIAEAIVQGESVQVVVHRALGFARLRGLIGRAPMRGLAALRFERCNSVHGCFMRRRLLVVFLDEAGAVTSCRTLDPWRFVSDRRATQVLEFELPVAESFGLRRARKFIFAPGG